MSNHDDFANAIAPLAKMIDLRKRTAYRDLLCDLFSLYLFAFLSY